jgi:nitrous oxidase accessory protein NosD
LKLTHPKQQLQNTQPIHKNSSSTMKFSIAIALIPSMASALTLSADYFGHEIPEYPSVPETAFTWISKPLIAPLELCNGISVDSNARFDHTIEVDHCLLDCKGHDLRGRGVDPVVYVRNGGQLVNCPIEVEKDSTGVVCDNGDCILVDVSCQGDKNFDECVLVKKDAKDVIILLLNAEDSNGTYGVRAIQAYDANLWIEASKIQNQRKDGVLVTQIKSLIMSHVDISYNGWDGVDARNVANYVVALASYFNDNGDEGFDTKRIKNFLLATSEANRNKRNGLEIVATSDAYVGIFDCHFDNNGLGTADNEDPNQSGALIEGPDKVEIAKSYAQYNKGDGYNLRNVHFLTVTESYASYNEADGFDLRRITEAKLFKVNSFQNYLTGVRYTASGELYVEDNSSFYENGQDTLLTSRDRSGLTVINTKKVFILESSSYQNGGYGFFTDAVSEIYIEYTQAYDNHDDGFNITTSTDVDIKYDTASSNNKGDGFALRDITRLSISEHVKAFLNEFRGFDIQDVDRVEIRKTDSFKNLEDGFYVFAVQYLHLEESFGAHNRKDGFFVDNGNVHAEVVYKNVVACENQDDGMVFQDGIDERSFWFTPNNDVFSCDNYDLDLQFDGVFDVSFGPSDVVEESIEQSPTTTTNLSVGGVNDITADTCADQNGDENVQACKDLNISPCSNFVCPTFD